MEEVQSQSSSSAASSPFGLWPSSLTSSSLSRSSGEFSLDNGCLSKGSSSSDSDHARLRRPVVDEGAAFNKVYRKIENTSVSREDNKMLQGKFNSPHPPTPPLPSHLSLPGHAGHQGKRVKQKRINSLQKHAIMIIMIWFSIDLLPNVAYSIPLLNKPFQYLKGKTSLSI